MRKTLMLVLLGSILALTPTSAMAARGGGGGGGGGSNTSGSSLSIDQPAPYRLGDWITFTPTTTATTKPWEQLRCYQAGRLVLSSSHVDYWPNALNDPGIFALGPTDLWQSGGAECVATLSMNTKRGMQPLATLSFSVSG